MSEIDNPSAFPQSIACSPSGIIYSSDFAGESMTLRDWFAGQCLERMISLSMDGNGAWEFDNVAHGAYQLADAMLRARASHKQEG